MLDPSRVLLLTVSNSTADGSPWLTYTTLFALRRVEVLTLTEERTFDCCQGKIENCRGVHARAMPESGREG
jgi:hypothetical protein